MAQDPSDPATRPAPAAAEPAPLLPDQTYEELGVLGRGGSAVVLRVRDNRLQREVALKRVEGMPGLPAHLVQGFLEEARLSSRLEHPNLVPVHAVGVDSTGAAYFTMKLVEGQTFHRWLGMRDRDASPSEVLLDALEVMRRVCDAAAYAHAAGVVHCDIKPGNILVGAHGEVYLMDWGIAQPVGAPTRLAGTPQFMAPDVLRGGTLTPATDVYALGAVLYYIVSRRVPFSGTDVASVLDAVRRADPPDLTTLDLPRPPNRALVEIVRRAMASAVGDRYADAGALGAALRAFLRSGQHLPELQFPAGAFLLHEGDVGDEAYLLLAGRARVTRSVQGEAVFVRELGPGEVFGELALLSSRPRSATVQAITPVVVAVVGRGRLESEVGLQGWVGALVRGLAERFRELEARADAGGHPRE